MKTKGEAWAESMESELKQKKNIQKKKINIQKAENMGYKQSPFPMVSGTSKHASALKDIGNKSHQKAHGAKHSHPPGTSFASQEKIRKKREPAEKQITKEHNIEAETHNPTGNTCMVCGESRGEHNSKSGVKPHAFKSSKK